jgi:hypothetical protein
VKEREDALDSEVDGSIHLVHWSWKYTTTYPHHQNFLKSAFALGFCDIEMELQLEHCCRVSPGS